MVLVASAQNDSVELFLGAILKGAFFAFYFLKERYSFETFGPMESHRVSSVTQGDVFAAILVALRSDIFSGVRGSNDKNARVPELNGISEVMGVQNSSFERLKAREVRHVRYMEMSTAREYEVES